MKCWMYRWWFCEQKFPQFDWSQKVILELLCLCQIENLTTETNLLQNSLMYVVSDSTLLHVPFPIADTALMRTWYAVPTSSATRTVDVVEPDVTWLTAPHDAPLFLYCTWYCMIATSLWGGVQVTFKAGLPKLTALDIAMSVTWDGTIQLKYKKYKVFLQTIQNNKKLYYTACI